MTSTKKQAEKSFSAIYGKPCWGLRQGHGSFLLLEFGQPSLVIREPRRIESRNKKVVLRSEQRIVTVRGEWHLWIYCCHWQILPKDAKKKAHSESTNRQIALALEAIEGEALQSVAVRPDRGSAEFQFDLGAKIKIARYKDLDNNGEPYENLKFFEPNGYVFSYRADGKHSYHKSNVAATREWLP